MIKIGNKEPGEKTYGIKAKKYNGK